MSRFLLFLAASTGLLATLLLLRPASQWLGALTPDGVLEAETARFLDAGWWLWYLAAALSFLAAVSSTWRDALAAAWRSPAPEKRTPSAWLAPAWGLLALALRLVVASLSDIGLGDDGARVFWLQEWLRAPHAVWSGLWLPAHLYLHALFYLVVRDAVWAGVLLSALASGGTVWILARAVEKKWGKGAACFAALTAAVLPVSMAYGSNPDVNPVFAFFVVAATASLLRSRRQGSSPFWLLTSWFCLVLATWMRFDTLVIVPALAALLLPRWRLAFFFAVASTLPLVLWNVADSLLTQQAGRVMQVVHQDPTLGGSIVSVGFSFLGALWQTLTLPVLVLGMTGAFRAMRERRGRAWIVPALVHGAALTGTTLVFHAGTQPRYFILIASVWAAFAGVALAGILSRSCFIGWSMAVIAAFLLVWTPALYPGGNVLWARRNPELRDIVDTVAAHGGEAHVVWVAEQSAYFYFCRIRPPLQRYHSLPRHDSDLQSVVDGLEAAQKALACVQQSPRPLLRWQELLERMADSWDVQLLEDRGAYRIFSMRRLRPGD